uniref:Zf-C2H2_12 domain-containing protein n=1 Tax=Caenorhabditis tropicalis TaxID=1561998 RepID=A0A1I7V484_9PELO
MFCSELICLFCSENLENFTSDEFDAHVSLCEVTTIQPLKTIKNRVMNYQFLWKSSYSEILKIHQKIDNGTLDDHRCVCESSKEHDQWGCESSKMYQIAAGPHYASLVSNFSSYISMKKDFELQKIDIECETVKNLTAHQKKVLRNRLVSAAKTAKVEQHDRFKRDVDHLREQHCNVHRVFDRNLTKTMG